MKWTSTIQISDSFAKAFREAADHIRAQLGGQPADLGLLFVSPKFRQELVDLWPLLRRELPIRNLIGCTGGGVIGAGKEVEDRSALSLTCAQLPNVSLRPFAVRQEELPESDGSPRPWRSLVKAELEDKPNFIILSDPFSLDADALVSGLDFAFPEAIKIGGLASGGHGPRENLLILNEKVFYRGAVGLSISGDIAIETIVAQGCRPIGEPVTVTACKDNVLLAVNNEAPIRYLSNLYDSLTPEDQELLRTSLFLGVVMDPFKTAPHQGDYLIRTIVGLDQEEGHLAIGAALRPGQTVQFHLRDAATSRDDLQLLLSKSNASRIKEIVTKAPGEAGAILFSCLGRGKRLYGKADHDTQLLKSVVGNIPVGGFFCNGEIGPVGGKTYLHGYTSSIAVFSAPEVRPTEKISRSSSQTLP